jgi:hypothetical protein
MAKEAEMRSTAMPAQTKTVSLPRGWIVLGMALASWLVVAAMLTGMSQIFDLVAAAV